MSQPIDHTSLLNEQYKDASNLNARIHLHERFSLNKYGWHRWVLDQFTIGERHLQEIDDLLEQVVPGTGWWGRRVNAYFTLENGHHTFSPHFSQIALRRYEDALEVTEAEPLIAFVLSGIAKYVLVDDKLGAFTALVERELRTHGAIRITKDTGLFEASGKR